MNGEHTKACASCLVLVRLSSSLMQGNGILIAHACASYFVSRTYYAFAFFMAVRIILGSIE